MLNMTRFAVVKQIQGIETADFPVFFLAEISPSESISSSSVSVFDSLEFVLSWSWPPESCEKYFVSRRCPVDGVVVVVCSLKLMRMMKMAESGSPR